jgi:hypothetical protein
VKLTVFCSPTPRRMESSYEGLGQSKWSYDQLDAAS